MSQTRETVSELVTSWQDVPGGLMPALWSVQNGLGYIPSDDVPEIASILNLSVAEVHGVISFYHDFKTEAPSAHTVKLCRAEACQAMGARELQSFAEQRLGAKIDEKGSNISLESVYCLGLCACAPAAMVDGKVKARLNQQTLGKLIDDCRSSEGNQHG
ncbi:MAG: NAD(P)H-dependent oxidoreductase subunit E [Pseudomonadales bacterium]